MAFKRDDIGACSLQSNRSCGEKYFANYFLPDTVKNIYQHEKQRDQKSHSTMH